MERLTKPRRFQLVRGEDISGVSGVGIVAQGCDFGTKTVLYWKGQYQALNVYDGIEALLAIHGHEGRTWVEWLDDEVHLVNQREPGKPVSFLKKLATVVRTRAGNNQRSSYS